ncbi:MAG: family 16 glycoside hydrolase, partial [Steroidobacteraceae bacterium]
SLLPEHCRNSTSKTFDGDQWVRAEVVVLGSGPVTQMANGEVVMEYSLPQYGGGSVKNFDPAAKPDGELISGGYLALQSESHPVEFRKVELLNLAGCMDPKAENYKSYYVKSERAQCRYGAKGG